MNTQVDTDMTGNHAGTPTEAEIRAVFGGLMIVLALAAIDQSIVSTALPRIVAELGGASLIYRGWSRPMCSPRPVPCRCTASSATTTDAGRCCTAPYSCSCWARY